MDQREPTGPEHLNQAGTRQDEGVGILLLSSCFLLFCSSSPSFFSHPTLQAGSRWNFQKKKELNEDGNTLVSQTDRPLPEMSPAASKKRPIDV